ncbi:response regulator [Chitinophaga pendula]|uniref:response regulator n=1 Tax=Chitinophaga TaxID=79328 RepID=UPI000BAFDDF6|nr:MULTISPECIES: response regulator [Chitinophaga]ASZ13653.1 response regulator [Chitinophaga sp. MD30]UCJ08722.1 response regulator [Chitinophaga pendula]
MTNVNKEHTHVLLAEDDDDDFMVFSMAVDDIKTIKIVLTRAENGEILMRLLDEKHPDILFLDLLMPCKDGMQCIREIRANKKFDSLPIIIYSSLADLKNIEFCYREGSNLYAKKPSSLQELRDILERIFAIDWKRMMYYPPMSQFVINE